MQTKALTEMSFSELSAELASAKEQEAAAQYQERLTVMIALQDAARARYAAVKAEIDLRLARLAAGGGVPAIEGDAHV